ncbi:MAG: S4 domain-containing protein YaaA [Bacilli bacterium]|nr:S4 domain-containing protein YaaA [Bacilli bacterium]
MVDVKITSEYITLGQFLKYVGIIGNGCEAKIYLVENDAYINDALDTRRGRKIYPGDVVRVNNQTYKVIS